MICTKCNSIIPDEAKFCPSCGAACTAAPAPAESKSVCPKCGLELEKSAKFCPVCGTGVAQTEPAAVSLEKPADSDRLVSAMPTEAPAGYSYTPSPNPIPGIGEPAPMPQYAPPAGSSTMPQYAPPAGSNTMPQYAPPAGAAPLGNMGSAGTAVAAAPVSGTAAKKKNGGKIAIIIGAVVLVLIAAATVFFFTNRSTFLSVFMGKSKYAAMVEGNSIKDTVESIDASAISSGVKAVSGLYSVANSMDSIDDFSDLFSLANSADGKPVMISTSNSELPEFDVNAIISTCKQMLTDTYGTDAVSVAFDADVNLTGTAKTALGNSSDIDTLLDIINGTTFKVDMAASDNAAGIQFGTEGKVVLNAKYLVSDDGSMYVMMPFASDKALMFKVNNVSSETETASSVVLELDEDEINRLISEIVQIYLNHYEKAVTDMGSGSITVDGDEISGKLISAEFSGDAMADCISEIIKHIGDDEYFSKEIIEFVSNCGGELSARDFSNIFKDIADEVDFGGNNTKFIVKTIIDNNGNVLAKSYAVDSFGEAEFAYRGTHGKDFDAHLIYNVDGEELNASFTNTKNSVTVDVAYSDGYNSGRFSVDCEKSDDKNGTCVITFSENDDGEFKINIVYNDVETVKFLKSDVLTGSVTISVEMPKELSSGYVNDPFYTLIDDAKLKISSKVSGDTHTVSVGVETSAYGEVSINYSVSAIDGQSLLTAPSNAIDITGLITGNGLDDTTDQLLDEFGQEVIDALEKIDILDNILDDFPTDLPGGTTPDTPDIPPVTPNDPDTSDPSDTPDTPDTPDIPGDDKASHANDNFNAMTADELELLSDEYFVRYYSVWFDGNLTDEQEDELDEAFYLMHDYYFDYVYDVDTSEETLNNWRNALRDFVILVEYYEALTY